MTEAQAQLVATAVVNRLLDKGLAESTWKDNHQAAYAELLKYRVDMTIDVTKVLKRMEIR